MKERVLVRSRLWRGVWLCILYFSLSGPTHTSAITASAVIQRYTKNCRDRKSEVRFSHQNGSNPSVLFVVSRGVLVSVQLEYDMIPRGRVRLTTLLYSVLHILYTVLSTLGIC